MAASIREIARQTGLSTACVSQALRGIGRISPATRARVIEAAEAMGYSPDPLVAQAFSRVRQPRAKRYRETMAYIIEWETTSGPSYQKIVHQSAMDQARRMGYGFEPFVVSGKTSEQRRLERILRARGIRGLLINPRLGSPQPRLKLDWSKFAAVEIGRTLWLPRNLSHIDPGEYYQVAEALHILKKAGYRRIGMAVEPDQNVRQRGIYYAAYLVHQLRIPPERQLPILASTGGFDEKHFRAWFKKYKPDVLIIHRPQLFSEWLANLRLCVPDDISLFCINAQEPHLSGLRRDYAGMGRAAVQMLAILLQSEEIGSSGKPRSLQIESFWQPGRTLSKPIDRYISEDGLLLPQHGLRPAPADPA